jgi:hypothetical protein
MELFVIIPSDPIDVHDASERNPDKQIRRSERVYFPPFGVTNWN